jgi:hypothetical protein
MSKLRDIIAEAREEREHLLADFQREREQWAQERASLLDRVQHPQVRQVQPGPQLEHEAPKDTAELAQVGLEVPEFVQVGTPASEMAFANETQTIGEQDGA